MTELTAADLLTPPQTPADRTIMELGLSAVARLAEMEGQDGRVDRFVLVDDAHDEKKVNTCVALGGLEERQDGAVLVVTDGDDSRTWGDVLTEDGEWDLDAINDWLGGDDVE